MTDRDRRRAAEEFARVFRCPGCMARAALEEVEPGVYVLEVRHDATCPTYAAMNGRSER